MLHPKKHLTNERGQGLIEYLIIVALVAVAGISVMSVMSQNIRAQFSNVAKAIQGESGKVQMDEVTETHYKKKDMSDFFQGSVKKEK